MKTLSVLFVSLISILSFDTYAQIGLRAKLEKKIYVSYEPIFATVTVSNNSGNTLNFKKDGGIYVSINREHGRSVSAFSGPTQFNVNVAGNLSLGPGTTRTLRFQVNRYFDVAKPELFTMNIKLIHDRLSSGYMAKPQDFMVREGQAVKSKRVGVPAVSGKIRYRTCSLVDFQDGQFSYYYLKIADDTLVYAMKRLSKHASGDKPRFEVDARSNIHILLHTQSMVFTYFVFNVHGELKQVAEYQAVGDNVPQMAIDPDIGRVMVTGGVLLLPEERKDELPNYKAPKFPN
ncbi:MAG: hypothetical protein MK193_06135 [Lentisphaeria bacterium]|nr:hypothetical protein [Lentisphaeria bacterium]